MGYICHNCNIVTNVDSLRSSSKILFEKEEIMEEYNERYKAGNGSYNIDWNLQEYYWIWICRLCNNINLHQKNHKNVITLIPILKFKNTLEKIKNCKNQDLENLVIEFFKCYTLNINSAAILLGRKILMHLSILETKCKENETFVYYINEIISSNILGNKWKPKLNILRKMGNDENHKIQVSSKEDVEVVKCIIIGLIENIYLQ